MFAESVHRYPRLVTWAIEILSALLVGLAVLNFGVVLLRYLWRSFALDRSLFAQIPVLPDIVAWIGAAPLTLPTAPVALLPSLFWLAMALLLTLLLRNALPIVRTSSRGMLVEFAGSWLPLPWENLRAIKVTNDPEAKHFVLLLQTDPRELTGWHRLYSLVYNLRWRRGFLITSSISQFEKLVQTVLTETDRAARASDEPRPPQLDESAQSLLFRLLISPVGFFSQRAAAPQPGPAEGADQAPALQSGPIAAVYPGRIGMFFSVVTLVFGLLLVWRFFTLLAQAMALLIPALRTIPPFRWTVQDAASVELINAYRTTAVPFFGVAGAPHLPAPWWLLVASLLTVAFFSGVYLVWRSLLPELEARENGLALRDMFSEQWKLIPWQQIKCVKATEISENNQVVLVQLFPRAGGLLRRFSSLLYDGNLAPGILITSAVTNFQPLLERILSEIMRVNEIRQPNNEQQPLQQEARSWLFSLAARPGEVLDRLVATARGDTRTQQIATSALLQAAAPMAMLALLPALFVLADGLLLDGTPPGFGLLLSALLLWFVSMLEWPLVSLLALLFDDMTGGGEEGYRAVYLYPTAQLPRLLPLLFGLLVLAVGLPLLGLLSWIVAIVYAFFLAAALWEALFGWKGSQAILGGLIPVIWQLMVLLVYLLVQR